MPTWPLDVLESLDIVAELHVLTTLALLNHWRLSYPLSIYICRLCQFSDMYINCIAQSSNTWPNNSVLYCHRFPENCVFEQNNVSALAFGHLTHY